MTTPMIRSWAVATVLSLVAAGVSVLPATAQPPAKGQRGRGPAITVTPLPDAEAVDKVPPLDRNGNFKVSATGAWADVPVLTVPAGVARGTVTRFTMKSEDSKFYPGLRGPYTRNV